MLMKNIVRNRQFKLPNFLIVGASRSGTTSLYYYLKQHPEIFLSNVKEPFFISAQFVNYPTKGVGDDYFFKRHVVKRFEDYCKLFESAAGKKAIGEASANNLYYSDKSIKYIKQFLGDPKIIIILRNPVERAFSAYMMLVSDGREYLSFDEALSQEKKRFQKNWGHIWMYKDSGLYYNSVRAFLENFSDVKVCLFYDLKNRPLSLMREIFEFLDVDISFVSDSTVQYNVSGIPKVKLINEFFVKPSKLQNVTRAIGKFVLGEDRWAKLRDTLRAKLLTKSEIKPEMRQYLKEFYWEDIKNLEVLLGRDLSNWRT